MSERIVACVTAVPDPEKIAWDRFRQLLDTQDAEPVLNAADRNALEIAAALAKSRGATFDAIAVGAGASSALRAAAVFGAARLLHVTGDGIDEAADAAGIAAILDGAIAHTGGADIVTCGDATSSYGSGAVPGYLSASLGAQLLVGVVETEMTGGLRATLIRGVTTVSVAVRPPAVIVAAPYGITVRTISPLLLMRAAKRPIETIALATLDLAPLPTTGAGDGPLQGASGRRSAERIEGVDAGARAATLAAALRERALL